MDRGYNCEEGENLRREYIFKNNEVICDISECPYNNLDFRSFSGESYQVCLSKGSKNERNLSEKVKTA